VIGLADEPGPQSAAPLLTHVVERGFRVGAPVGLAASRARCERMLAELPRGVRLLEPSEAYPVSRSAALEALTDETATALGMMTGRAAADYPKR